MHEVSVFGAFVYGGSKSAEACTRFSRGMIKILEVPAVLQQLSVSKNNTEYFFPGMP